MSVPDDPFNTASSSGTTSRPPAITVTTPAAAATAKNGNKTPRRVQWTTDSHIISMEQPGSPSSTLDEAGLEELRSALERHKSGRSSRKSKPTIPEDPSSSSHGHDGEEDYDYRLDTDPYPHPDLESIRESYDTTSGHGDENDPLRSYPPRAVHPTAQGVIPVVVDDPTKGSGPDINDDLPENDVHYQMPVFVDPNETDGMPSLLPPGEEAAENSARASALVRAHTGGRAGGFLRKRRNNLKAVTGAMGLTKPKSEDEKKMDAFAKRYPNSVSGANATGRTIGVGKALGATTALAGGGVLASLLSLYDNGLNGQSGTSTPGGSQAPSTVGSSDEERDHDEDRRRRRKHEEKKRGWATLTGHKSKTGGGALEDRTSRPTSMVESTRSDTPDMTGSPVLSPTERTFNEQSRSKSQGSLRSFGRDGWESPHFFQQVKRAADKIGLDVESKHDRPKAARSGAGVMGALMQSTGNLTGAAAPHLSTVGPAAKRSGYRLSR